MLLASGEVLEVDATDREGGTTALALVGATY